MSRTTGLDANRIRRSTWVDGAAVVVPELFELLPRGLMLNLGAGVTGVARNGRRSVNVDFVQPSRLGPGWFVIADGEALPFRDAVFEGVLAKDVLEHVDDPYAVLEEARRVVGPGGGLIVTTPRAVPRAVWNDPTHRRGFTRRSLDTLLGTTGWTLLRSPRRLGPLPGAGRMHLRLRLILAVLKVPLLGHRFGTNWLIEARSVPWRDHELDVGT